MFVADVYFQTHLVGLYPGARHLLILRHTACGKLIAPPGSRLIWPHKFDSHSSFCFPISRSSFGVVETHNWHCDSIQVLLLQILLAFAINDSGIPKAWVMVGHGVFENSYHDQWIPHMDTFIGKMVIDHQRYHIFREPHTNVFWPVGTL